MNEQQIQSAFRLFQDRGYTGDINHFRGLMANNQDAINDAKDLLAQETPVEKKSLFESPIINQQQEPPSKGGASKPAPGSSASQGVSVFSRPIIEQPAIPGPLVEERQPEAKMLTGRELAVQNIPIKETTVPERKISIPPSPLASNQYIKSDFNKSLNNQIPDLFSRGSDGAKEQMEYYFSDYGYKFEQDGDELTIIAPNGAIKKIDVSKDNIENVKRFMGVNAPEDKSIIDLEKNNFVYQRKIKDEQDKANKIKQFSDEQNNFRKMFDEYIGEKKMVEVLLKKIQNAPESVRSNPKFEEYVNSVNERAANLEKTRQAIIETQKIMDKKETMLQKNLGEYISMKSEQGNWVDGLIVSVNNGLANVAKGIVNTTELLSYLRYPQFSSDAFIKSMQGGSDAKKETIEAINTYIEGVKEGSGVSKEWFQKKHEGLLTGAVLGTAEIVPALAGSAIDPMIGPAIFYTQGVGSAIDEMDKSDAFKDVPDLEKQLIAAPIGMVMAALGAVGNNFKAANEKVAVAIANKILSESGKDVTIATFKELVENEIKSATAKGLLTFTKDGVAHFATGAAMNLEETGIKATYNLMKGKEMFEMPDSPKEFAEQTIRSGVSMWIGGGMMDLVPTVANSFKENNFNGMTDAEVMMFSKYIDDPVVRQAQISKLVKGIADGKLTVEEANMQKEWFDKAAGLMKSIPEEFTPAQKRKSLGLLKEKTELENAIKGKDAAMVKPQQERINEINKQLEEISKTKEDAIQKQATDEGVLRQEQPAVELQKMGEGNKEPQVPAEETVKEEVAKQTYTERAKALADRIRAAELPTWLEGIKPEEGETIETRGLTAKDLKEGVAKAVEKAGELMDKGVDMIEAIKPHIEDLVKIFGEEKRNEIQRGIISEMAKMQEVKTIAPKEQTEAYSRMIEEHQSRVDKLIESGASESEIRDQQEMSLSKLNEDVQRAKKQISTSDDTDAAIKNYNEIKAAKESFEKNIAERNDAKRASNNIRNILEDEATASERDDYEYKDLYEKDPRLAALQNAKDMIEFVKSEDFKKAKINSGRTESEIEDDIKRSVKSRERDIKDLENSLAKDNIKVEIPEVKIEVKTEPEVKTETEAEVKVETEPKEKKPEKAPSVNKIMGVEEPKITITEKSALKNQIKSLARGAKDAVAAVKQVTDYVSGVVKEAQAKGKIGARQAAAIAKRVANTNMLNPKHVSRLTDYIQKVFADADYADNVAKASGLRKAVNKLSKREGVDAFTKSVAKEFVKIDPKMVEDLAAHKEAGEALREALKGSSITKGEVSIAKSADLKKITEYIESAKQEQFDKMVEDMRDAVEEKFGVDAKDMSYEEMNDMLKGKTEKKVVDEEKNKQDIKDSFDSAADEIDHILKNGTDKSGEMDYELSKSDRKMLEEYSGMDIESMNEKDALEAIDAMNNFIENGTKAKMMDVLAKYKGKKGVSLSIAEGLIGRAPKFFGRTARFVGEQFFNKPLLIENMFRGFYNAAKLEKLMGFASTMSGKATAERLHKDAVNGYVKEFYKLKPNGKKFNTQLNIIERGMYAFMNRTVTGTPEQQRAEFIRRKGLIEQSIKWLSEGTENEKKMAEGYQEVYDKILKDSESRDDVWKKTNATNVDAVEYWEKKWMEKRDLISDISEGIYNTILENDIGYTPDRLAKFEEGFTPDIVDAMSSAFHSNSGMALAKSKAGSLMEATRPDKLPTNSKTGGAARYVNLSFDNVNSNAYRDAMIDVHTAEGIRQMDAFINSTGLKDVIPNGDDRALFVKMIQNYSKDVRNVNLRDYDQFDKMSKSLDKLAKIGGAAALGSLSQAFKQTVPVAMNTLVNTKGRLNIFSIFNSDIQNFINKSGQGIAIRGLETIGNIDSINRSIKTANERASNKPLDIGKQAGKGIVNLVEFGSEKWMKLLLEKPDILIARASWISYYEKYIKDHPDGPERGDVKNIDYSKPETINQDAADYAQKMVDRQQNISDKDLQGQFFANKEAGTRILSKMLFSFASFRMNQTVRMHTDLTTLLSKTASAEDRTVAAKSLAGFGAEMVWFKYISFGLASAIHNGIMSMLGIKETEEEKERFQKGLWRNTKTTTVNDLLSPFPILDPYVSWAANKFYYEPKYESMLIKKEEQELLYDETKQEFTKFLGSIGIPFEKANSLIELRDLAKTGEYEDKYGNVKKISRENQDILKEILPWATANMFGLLPTEMQTISNAAMKYAKGHKEVSTEPSKSFLKKYYPEEYYKKYPWESPAEKKPEPKFINQQKKSKSKFITGGEGNDKFISGGAANDKFITTKKGRGGKFITD